MAEGSKTLIPLFPGDVSGRFGKERGGVARTWTTAPGEMALAYSAILAALWTSSHWVQLLWMGLATALILYFSLSSQVSRQQLGFGVARLHGALWALAAGLCIAAAIPMIGLAAGLSVPANPAWPPVHDLLDYTIWSLVQQFILQSFFFVRLESLVGPRKAVLLTALLFSAAHLPSPVLTLATFPGGLYFCEAFRRCRSIYPLGLAHAVLGIAVALTVPNSLLHHMRVGIGYLNFH